MAAKVDHKETQDLAAYGLIVLQLAQKHGGTGWLVYDRQFRRNMVAGASMPWADINPSLMAATVLGPVSDGRGRSCPLCLAADHTRDECALAAMERLTQTTPARPQASPSRPSCRFTPYPATDSTCRRFNHRCHVAVSLGHSAQWISVYLSTPDPFLSIYGTSYSCFATHLLVTTVHHFIMS